MLKSVLEKFSSREARYYFITVAVFSIIFSYAVHQFTSVGLNFGRRNYELYYGAALILSCVLILLAFVSVVFDRSKREMRFYIPLFPLGFLPVFVWLFIYEYFGFFDLSSVVHQFFTGTDGFEPDGLFIFVAYALTLAFISSMGALYILGARMTGIRKFANVAGLCIALFNPVTVPLYRDMLGGSIDLSPDGSIFAPVNVQRNPEAATKNIIHIYLESTERTFADIPESETAMAPLMRLAATGFEAVNIQQVAATGWTMAGTVASQCGVPLVYPFMQVMGTQTGTDDFMPGANCLTDILQDEGYTASFINGFKLDFAGTGSFMKSHSYERMTGLMDSGVFDSEDEKGAWGIYDDVLFEQAIKEVVYLDRAEKPYYLSLFTTGGHFPNGMLSKWCPEDQDKTKSEFVIVQAISCTNLLTEKFVADLKEKGLLENTIVIVQSDHFIMKNPLTPQLNKSNRANFFAIFGDGIEPQRNDKVASMMDVFPTILEFAGFDVADGKAALGVSLLSDEPSHLASAGESTFNRALLADKNLSSSLWTRDSQMAAYDVQ